jgi:ABC-type transporter Mla subunit MlaD
MTLALMLDILLAVLLAVTIGYAIVLNRRLGALRRDRSELEALAASFTEATSRADASVGKLAKNAAELQARIDQARSLADDLEFLTGRGEKTADRLEQAVRAGRAQAPVDPVAAVQRSDAPAAQTEPADSAGSGALRATRDEGGAGEDGAARSDAERALLKALRSAG